MGIQSDIVNRTISHYRILEKIGQGGMAVVYKAEDLRLKRIVAVKLHPRNPSIQSDERRRFFREAQAASSLNHPNICVIHEIDEFEEGTFIVMEYVDGVTLREWARKMIDTTKSALTRPYCVEAAGIALQAASGLAAAHEKGILHRDVKSENIMVTEDGRVKVMDFGLAKLQDSSKLTKTGSTLGTAAYMSPEQVQGIETDHRSDIFSFGVVLYEMFSGHVPFQADYESALLYQIVNVESKPLIESREGIDAALNTIVMRCLKKNREERYQSMQEIALDLERYRQQPDSAIISKGHEPAQQRKLAAIMFTDIVGYTSLTQANESLSLELLEEHRRILRSLFPKYHGREIETIGDSFFVEFDSALQATRCALEIQQTLAERNAGQTEEKKIQLRIGVHVGDVVYMGKNIHGDTVNVAARVHPLALPGGVVISEDVWKAVKGHPDISFVSLGPRHLKGMNTRIKVFALSGKGLNVPSLKQNASSPRSIPESTERVVLEGAHRDREKGSPLSPTVAGITPAPQKGAVPPSTREGTISDEESLTRRPVWTKRGVYGGIALIVVAVLAVFLSRTPGTGDGRGLAHTHLERAIALMDSNRLTEAKGELESAVAADPSYSLAWSSMAAVNTRLGNLDIAVTQSRRAISLDPGNANAYYNLAYALEEKGEMSDALTAYGDAVRMDSSYMPAQSALANLLIRLDMPDRAAALLQRALQIAPGSRYAFLLYRNLGRAYLKTDRVDESIAALRKSVALQPDQGPEPHTLLASAYHSKGMFREAKQELLNYIALETDSSRRQEARAFLQTLGEE